MLLGTSLAAMAGYGPLVLGKTGPYRAQCHLVITHRDELEAESTTVFDRLAPEMVGSEYAVLGTVELRAWRRGMHTVATIEDGAPAYRAVHHRNHRRVLPSHLGACSTAGQESMSYHETYEFFAIDRPLSPDAMRALRAISTRAVITSARFYNFYNNWGGLKGDPRDMLARYFDLFVHTGNGRPDWGMLRFPAGSIDLGVWRRYVEVQKGTRRTESAANVAAAKDVLILDMAPAEDTVLLAVRSGDREDVEDGWDYEDDEQDDEDYDDEWYDDGWRGDDWYGDNEMAMDEASWPVSLALVRAALLGGDVRPLYLLWLLSVQWGERRPAALEPPHPPDDAPLTGWLYLFAEFLQLNPDLLAVALDARASEPRTAGQLLTAARDRIAERERAEAARAAAARRRRLAALEKRQESEWSEIDQLLDAPKVLASVYGDVIQRLTELRELAEDRGKVPAYQERLRALLERHKRKPALLRHVRDARLVGGGENG